MPLRKVTVTQHHTRSGRATYLYNVACSCGYTARACGRDNANARALRHQDTHLAARYGHQLDDRGRRYRDGRR